MVNQIGNKSFAEKLKKRSQFFVNQPKASYGYQLSKLAEKMMND